VLEVPGVVALPHNEQVPSAFRRTITDALLSVLLAPVCAACAQPLDEPTRGPVCRSCWRAVNSF